MPGSLKTYHFLLNPLLKELRYVTLLDKNGCEVEIKFCCEKYPGEADDRRSNFILLRSYPDSLLIGETETPLIGINDNPISISC